MRALRTFRIGLVMAAGAVAAGCATGPGSPAAPANPSAGAAAAPPAGAAANHSAAPSNPSTGAAAAPPEPSDPPREPGDQPPAAGWVSGMITRGGTGPCYGFLSDDGTRYALHGTAGDELDRGDRVRVRLEATALRIHCGPGTLMAMTAVEPIT